MGGVVKAIVGVVGLAAIFIPGVGTAIGAALAFSGASAGVATAIGYGIMAAGVGLGVSTVMKIAGLGPKSPKASTATSDRLTASINPRAFRASVVGNTAFNTDVVYQEFTGSNQEYFNQIIECASHPVQSIDEIWIDDEIAWSAVSGVAAKYSGYLAVTKRTEGTTANAFTITGSSSWVSGSSRLVGCAYVWMRYKLTGNSKKAESPFSSGLSSRITIIGKGAKLYDPRLDSTVGGSGSQRANNQATWAWVSDSVGRNPALQLLWFLLGYRIQNPSTSAFKIAVGAGLPPERIDIASFITAANMCDEPVTLTGGGTEPRYRADGVWNEGDDPKTVQDVLLASMNGVLRDAGGRLRLDILHNDLGTPVVTLTHADVVGEFQWIQTPSIDQTFNVVRGQYVDASRESLFQMVDYPDVRIASPDGIERDDQFICPMVQSASQAQRLAKAYLQRAQYPGTFSAEFLASAWRCEVGSAIEFTFPALGFNEKLFRVVEHSIQINGLCRMVLREENATIYAWDADESPAVVAADPITYDPLNNPLVQGIAIAGTYAYLTNEAATVSATSSGSVPSFAGIGGTFVVIDGDAPATTGMTFSVVSATGMTITINSVGVYAVSAMSADTATATLRVVYDGRTFERIFSVAKSKAGSDGASSGTAVSAYLTNESFTVFAFANGNVSSYDGATGDFRIFSGSTDISASFTLSTFANPQSLTVGYSARTYSVTGGFDNNEDTASVTIRATGSGAYAGIVVDKVFSLSKAKGGYEIVGSLPTTDLFSGRVIFNEADDKLYRYTGTEWTAAVPAADVSGQIEYQQIGDGAVRVNHLLVQPNNLHPDPQFRDPSLWFNLNQLDGGGNGILGANAQGWFTQEFSDPIGGGVPAYMGSRWVQLFSGRAGQNNNARFALYAQSSRNARFAVTPGQVLELKAAVQNASNQAIFVAVEYERTDGVFVSGFYTFSWAAGEGGLKSVQTTVPSNAAWGRVVVYNFGQQFGAATYSGFAIVSNISVRDTAGASMIVDGAIVAGKVAANAITADKIEAGAITAAKVGTNEIVAFSANIKDLTVSTVKIAGNAVTLTSSAYTSTSVNLIDDVWVDVQSVTITTIGAPILILFNGQSSQVTSGVFDIIRYRILRDATVIQGPIENWAYDDENRNVSLSITDVPGAGTITYKVQAFLQTSGGSANLTHRSLVAMETKR